MSDRPNRSTQFASAERGDVETAREHWRRFAQDTLLSKLLDAMPCMVLILDRCRQIVYANRQAGAIFSVANREAVCGLRPGEALHCVHACEQPAGCGTAAFCRACGAVRAILDSQTGAEAVYDCRIQRGPAHSDLDLRVWATPIEHGAESFTLFAVNDIADEKRRRALERVFFHDILNMAGGLLGLSEMTRREDPRTSAELPHYVTLLHATAKKLVDDLKAQKDLAAAEHNELAVSFEAVDAGAFLEDLVGVYERHEVAEGRRILFEPPAAGLALVSDERLLRRVLGNMIKNALEGTAPGGAIAVRAEAAGRHVEFAVHNDQAMPPDVQLQVFQRSFSTKGSDRGLGTYSMKLFTERYLGGTVSFTSTPETGTTFRCRLPLMPPAQE